MCTYPAALLSSQTEAKLLRLRVHTAAVTCVGESLPVFIIPLKNAFNAPISILMRSRSDTAPQSRNSNVLCAEYRDCSQNICFFPYFRMSNRSRQYAFSNIPSLVCNFWARNFEEDRRYSGFSRNHSIFLGVVIRWFNGVRR